MSLFGVFCNDLSLMVLAFVPRTPLGRPLYSIGNVQYASFSFHHFKFVSRNLYACLSSFVALMNGC